MFNVPLNSIDVMSHGVKVNEGRVRSDDVTNFMNPTRTSMVLKSGKSGIRTGHQRILSWLRGV